VIVFVHGVPETAAIWAKVRRQIGGDSVALALPGFGCSRPAGFGASKDDYVDWLVGQLDQLDGPVDLVGHDWGALLTYRIATAFGDHLRSWVADVGNLAHPAYEWHGIARIWQTPGDGEAFVEAQAAMPPEARATGLEALGVPAADALELATGYDATMGGCILDLYRSAVPNPHHQWGPLTLPGAPGVVLHATEDPFSEEGLAAEVAASLGARFERLVGAGHFWPYQVPEAATAALEAFWASLS
jgi:pimeloyl-ACP methyl ester carboxylesterase